MTREEQAMPTETVHRRDRDHGRNVHCVCGAEYSLTSNLMRHIDRENERD